MMFGWSYLVIWMFLFAAILFAGLVNAQRVNDIKATQHQTCAVVLTLSRLLFYPLPETPDMGEPLRRYTQVDLARLYYEQYRLLDRRFDLEDLCGGTLPEGTPPPPPRP